MAAETEPASSYWPRPDSMASVGLTWLMLLARPASSSELAQQMGCDSKQLMSILRACLEVRLLVRRWVSQRVGFEWAYCGDGASPEVLAWAADGTPLPPSSRAPVRAVMDDDLGDDLVDDGIDLMPVRQRVVAAVGARRLFPTGWRRPPASVFELGAMA